MGKVDHTEALDALQSKQTPWLAASSIARFEEVQHLKDNYLLVWKGLIMSV